MQQNICEELLSALQKKSLSLKSVWTEKLPVPSEVKWEIEINFC